MALKKYIRSIALYGDHICPLGTPDHVICTVEQMPGFVHKKCEVRDRKETARMLIAAYNHVFCKKPLPKSIQKLI